ncbi:MAG: S-4TM family putative pore-forming effector [Acidobacteriota bacterium]
MSSVNPIPELENQEEHLKQLAAQRQLYSEAKTTLAWQIILVVPVAIGFSLAAIFFSAFQPWAAAFGLVASLFDVLWLEKRQGRLSQRAATIQEMFDCEVLCLPWPDAKIEDRPQPEEVIAPAARYSRRKPNYSGLRNWYPSRTGDVPLAAARIICQRSNLRWDSDLRKRFSAGVCFGLVALAVVLLIIGLLVGMTLEKFVYGILAPLQPAFLWGIREYGRERQTADRLDRMMTQATDLLEKACARTLSDNEMEQASRVLQSEIYDHRRTARTLFDWVYNRWRKQSEDEMTKAVEALVSDCLKKGAGK